MDLGDQVVGSGSHTETCSACNRTFLGPGGLQNHLRGCKPSKKRLRHTLTAAKDVLLRRKRQRGEKANSQYMTNESAAGTAEVTSGDAMNVRYYILHSVETYLTPIQAFSGGTTSSPIR